MNRVYCDELKEDLRGFMRVYAGLIIKLQKAHYDEVVRGEKRKDSEADADKSKR